MWHILILRILSRFVVLGCVTSHHILDLFFLWDGVFIYIVLDFQASIYYNGIEVLFSLEYQL